MDIELKLSIPSDRNWGFEAKLIKNYENDMFLKIYFQRSSYDIDI